MSGITWKALLERFEWEGFLCGAFFLGPLSALVATVVTSHLGLQGNVSLPVAFVVWAATTVQVSLNLFPGEFCPSGGFHEIITYQTRPFNFVDKAFCPKCKTAFLYNGWDGGYVKYRPLNLDEIRGLCEAMRQEARSTEDNAICQGMVSRAEELERWANLLERPLPE